MLSYEKSIVACKLRLYYVRYGERNCTDCEDVHILRGKLPTTLVHFIKYAAYHYQSSALLLHVIFYKQKEGRKRSYNARSKRYYLKGVYYY